MKLTPSLITFLITLAVFLRVDPFEWNQKTYVTNESQNRQHESLGGQVSPRPVSPEKQQAEKVDETSRSSPLPKKEEAAAQLQAETLPDGSSDDQSISKSKELPATQVAKTVDTSMEGGAQTTRHDVVRLPQQRSYLDTWPLRISKAAREHIVKFETGGRWYFEKKYLRPQWPGYASGVTVGYGYDLGYHSKGQVRDDWSGIASPQEIAAMQSVVGAKGSSAQFLAKQIRSKVHLDWNESGKVFDEVTVPRWCQKTATAYRLERGQLHPDCNGALVGNTFNRGPGMAEWGKKREKWLIREAIASGDLASVPEHFRAQQRHWPSSSGPNGLQQRRRDEADLFSAGQFAMTSALSWPPEIYALEDANRQADLSAKQQWSRNSPIGVDHPVWSEASIHPNIVARKERILGIGRPGYHQRVIRYGTLVAASASAHKAEQLGYHLYVTSGNRWGVSKSSNHGQDGNIGDSIDFIITTQPGGAGDRLPATPEGMQHTTLILAAAVQAGANGIGWGRSNGAGHHVEVDDKQRGIPGAVWQYDDWGREEYKSFARNFYMGRFTDS